MQEVGETVRRKNEVAAEKFNEKMQMEATRIRKEYQTQQEKYGKA
jgi:hypothetical protein